MASTLLRAARRGVCTSADAGPVGVIGLGNMGAHMARNLLRAGRAVVVSDVSPGAMDGLASAGAATAHSPAEVAARVEEYRRVGLDEVGIAPATAEDPGGAASLAALGPLLGG